MTVQQMSEAMRIRLASNPESERMYGPALMGLPTRHGHLCALVPVVGMKLTMPGGRMVEITAVVYGMDRNIIRCTCQSNGETTVRPWNQLFDAIEADRLAVAK